jgi:hypothetical protein
MRHDIDQRFALPTCERLEAREEIPVRDSVGDGEDVRIYAAM